MLPQSFTERMQGLLGSEYEEFLAGFAANRLPLGYEVKTSKPVALPLKQFNQLSMRNIRHCV